MCVPPTAFLAYFAAGGPSSSTSDDGDYCLISTIGYSSVERLTTPSLEVNRPDINSPSHKNIDQSELASSQ